eukprot:TRINITY_DN18442_c0_g1_i1.p1 TRINITY_DN18442_c0_g1~~TRINITY_DN18442_c0_g1_i1.p1  ORF type:complete len:954 (+),score=305.92 TRINITY_DN18442_c0_g1_i1:84-2945(+)
MAHFGIGRVESTFLADRAASPVRTYREPRVAGSSRHHRLPEHARDGVRPVAVVPVFKGRYGGNFDHYGETGEGAALSVQARSTGIEYPVDAVYLKGDAERSYSALVVEPLTGYLEPNEHYGVYAVGARGAGKSTALFAEGEQGVGVVYELLNGLLAQLQKELGAYRVAGRSAATALLTMSAFELHADLRVVDLLNPKNAAAAVKAQPPDRAENAKQLVIDCLTEKVVEDEVDGVDLILEALSNRAPADDAAAQRTRPSTVIRFGSKLSDGGSTSVNVVDVVEVHSEEEPAFAELLKHMANGSPFTHALFRSAIMKLALPKYLLSGVETPLTLLPCCSAAAGDKKAATATLKLMRDAYELRVVAPLPKSNQTAPIEATPLCASFSFRRCESFGDFTLSPGQSDLTPLAPPSQIAISRGEFSAPTTPLDLPMDVAGGRADRANGPAAEVSIMSPSSVVQSVVSVNTGAWASSSSAAATPMQQIQALQVGIKKVADDLRSESSRRLAAESHSLAHEQRHAAVPPQRTRPTPTADTAVAAQSPPALKLSTAAPAGAAAEPPAPAAAPAAPAAVPPKAPPANTSGGDSAEALKVPATATSPEAALEEAPRDNARMELALVGLKNPIASTGPPSTPSPRGAVSKTNIRKRLEAAACIEEGAESEVLAFSKKRQAPPAAPRGASETPEPPCPPPVLLAPEPAARPSKKHQSKRSHATPVRVASPSRRSAGGPQEKSTRRQKAPSKGMSVSGHSPVKQPASARRQPLPATPTGPAGRASVSASPALRNSVGSTRQNKAPARAAGASAAPLSSRRIPAPTSPLYKGTPTSPCASARQHSPLGASVPTPGWTSSSPAPPGRVQGSTRTNRAPKTPAKAPAQRSSSPQTVRPGIGSPAVVLDLKRLDRSTRKNVAPTRKKRRDTLRSDCTPRVHSARKLKTPRGAADADTDAPDLSTSSLWLDL